MHELEQTAPIAKQRAKDYKILADKNVIFRHGCLEREQARIEQESDLANLQSRLMEIDATINATYEREP